MFAAIPFRALDLGAGPVSLGVIPGLYAIAYMASASRSGRLSDRVPRLRLARLASLAAVAAVLGVAAAPTLPVLFAVLPFLGAALGFFWSPLQAALSDRAESRDLPGVLGAFNVSWTLGKGTGLVLGGLLTAAFSSRAVLLIAAAPLLLTAAFLPRDRAAHTASAAAPAAGGPVSDTVLRLAWMANALAYGLVGTVNMHAPRLFLAQGAGPAAFGALLGTVFGVQTLVFLLARDRPVGRGMLGTSLACGVLGLVLFLGTHGLARGLAAVPFGVATGLAYHASLRASLDRPHGRGRAAGWHETLLGAGSTSVPLLGGWAAAGTGSLAAPFVVAGAVLLSGLLIVLAGRKVRAVA